MITKYVTGLYGTPIEKVEIVRETNSFVIRHGKRGNEVRDAKRSQYSNYFDTYAEAKEFLVQHYKYLAEQQQRLLDATLAKLQQAENLEE
jgi:hypothetical protein